VIAKREEDERKKQEDKVKDKSAKLNALKSISQKRSLIIQEIQDSSNQDEFQQQIADIENQNKPLIDASVILNSKEGDLEHIHEEGMVELEEDEPEQEELHVSSSKRDVKLKPFYQYPARTRSVGALNSRMDYVKKKKQILDFEKYKKNLWNLYKRDAIRERRSELTDLLRSMKVNSNRSKVLVTLIKRQAVLSLLWKEYSKRHAATYLEIKRRIGGMKITKHMRQRLLVQNSLQLKFHSLLQHSFVCMTMIKSDRAQANAGKILKNYFERYLQQHILKESVLEYVRRIVVV